MGARRPCECHVQFRAFFPLVALLIKLRTRKRLLNGASVGCLLATCWVVLSALAAGPPTVVSESSGASSGSSKFTAIAAQPLDIVDAKHKSWQRKLRQPLYDPPPPPKVVVKKQVRPVTVKLTGTVLEPKNSQAFLKLANGSVALKRIGDQVTDNPLDGRITAITASEIVIQREDDEIRLKVGGQN